MFVCFVNNLQFNVTCCVYIVVMIFKSDQVTWAKRLNQAPRLGLFNNFIKKMCVCIFSK